MCKIKLLKITRPYTISKMTTEIETYFNSLPEDILTIDITFKSLKSLPDLTRFKNLQVLYCYNNQLTMLPTLPQNLELLYCDTNQLTVLPTLPQKLKILYCSDNQLTSLPTLPQNLKELNCSRNELTVLSALPQNLELLYCFNNQLTVLPTLPQKLKTLNCSNNPIYEIVYNNSLIKIKQNIQTLNNFRHLYYSLKLRNWLWKKVLKHIIEKIYHPIYLIENLGDDDDLEAVLNNWK